MAGGQHHSIGVSGMALFDRAIESTIGGITIDLVSAPIAPGDHRLVIDAGIGGIEIYVPRHAQLTYEGGAVIGGLDIHEGRGLGAALYHEVAKLLRLPNRIPDRAVPPVDPSLPVKLHLVIDGTIGGVDIYRI